MSESDSGSDSDDANLEGVRRVAVWPIFRLPLRPAPTQSMADKSLDYSESQSAKQVKVDEFSGKLKSSDDNDYPELPDSIHLVFDRSQRKDESISSEASSDGSLSEYSELPDDVSILPYRSWLGDKSVSGEAGGDMNLSNDESPDLPDGVSLVSGLFWPEAEKVGDEPCDDLVLEDFHIDADSFMMD